MATDACIRPLVYALDTLVPIVDLGQRSAWTPDSSIHSNDWWNSGRALATATWLTTLLGWATAVLITAGFTQAINRNSRASESETSGRSFLTPVGGGGVHGFPV